MSTWCRRTFRVLATAAAVIFASWWIAAQAPGGLPARALEARSGGQVSVNVSPDRRRGDARRLAVELDVGGSALSVGLRAVVRAASLDFGTSWRHHQPVFDELVRAGAKTLVLLLLILLIGIGGGILFAHRQVLHPRTWRRVASRLALCAPPLWIGLIALRGLASPDGWAVLPTQGWGSVAALILPVAALAPSVMAVVFFHLSAELEGYRRSSLATAARAKGLSESELVRRHGLRLAIIARAPLLTTLTAYVVGAMLVIERLFEIRGLGWLLIHAATHSDIPILAGGTAVIAAWVAIAAVVVDAVRDTLDPRRAEVAL